MADTKKDNYWKGYVNYSLNEKQKKALKQIRDDETAMSELIFKALDLGDKLTLKYDQQNQCFLATVTGSPFGENKGYGMTSRSKDPQTALLACAYKSIVVFKGLEWTKENQLQLL